MKIKLVLPKQYFEYDSQVRPMLESALKHGHQENDYTHWLALVLTYQAQLWVITSEDNKVAGTLITRINTYSNYKSLQVVLLAGFNFKSWVHLYSEVEAFAKANECKKVEQWGRIGWTKLLPRLINGFKPSYQVMTKDI